MVGTLKRLPAQAERKVGMTSSHHGPYAQGYTRATMGGTEGCYLVTVMPISKSRSQFGLKSATRLHEAGIASNRVSAMTR